MTKPKLNHVIAVGIAYWCALTSIAIVVYGLFVGYVTSGALSIIENTEFRNETIFIFVLGAAIGLTLEFANIWYRARSFLQRPILFIFITFLIVLAITIFQIMFPERSEFYSHLQSGMDTDSLWLALFADLMASMTAVFASGGFFLWSFWNVVNPKFALIDLESQLGDAE